jgi:hypothetical protein
MFANLNTYLTLALKISFILGSLIFIIFAVIVVKQTTMMSKNVSDKFNPVLIAIAYLHLAFSVFIVFLTLVIL